MCEGNGTWYGQHAHEWVTSCMASRIATMSSRVSIIEINQAHIPCVEGLLKEDNEQIAKWNARAREVREREICSQAIVAKQRVLEDFWFKPYIGNLAERSS